MGVVFLSDISTEIFEEIETETEPIIEVTSPADPVGPAIADATSTDWILIYIVFFIAIMFWWSRSER